MPLIKSIKLKSCGLITKNINSRKNFFIDIILNVSSAAIVAVLLQFVIYPTIGNRFDQNSFGEILTIMGLVNIIAVMLGNSLNNIRLIVENDYKEKNIIGDFNPLISIASLINIGLIIFMSFFLNIKPTSTILLVGISLMTMIRSYLEVAYRLKIDYKMILFHSIFYCIGLIIGALLLWIDFSQLWEILFLIGESFSLVFLILTASLHKEPMKITFRFKSTLIQYSYLALSSLIANILVYLDRLIILPLLGGKAVAIYFAATIIGKMSSFVLQPISGVLLTYFSKSNEAMKVKEFWFINVLVIIFSGIALVGCMILSAFLLKLLYPKIYLDAMNILLIANLAAILTASSSITQSIILRFCATFWQVTIQISYGIIYVSVGLILIKNYGLFGFCVAAIIAIVFKILLMLVVGTFSLRSVQNVKQTV